MSLDNEIEIITFVDPTIAGTMTEVAEHLSGRAVVVDIDGPATVGAHGNFTRGEDDGYIRIKPRLTHDRTLFVLLHEVAHAKLHWSSIRASDSHLAVADSIPDDGSFNTPEYQAEETEANDQANQWLNYARSWIDIDGDDYLTDALEVLMSWQ